MFAKHGELHRVVLPPSGVTAVIEFYEPTEARAAFRKLAYSKFHGTPLFLEWAPGVKATKLLFFFVFDDSDKLARVFVTAEPFHPFFGDEG